MPKRIEIERVLTRPSKDGFNFQVFGVKDKPGVVIARGVKLVDIHYPGGKVIVDPHLNSTVVGTAQEVGIDLARRISSGTRTDLVHIFQGTPDPQEVIVNGATMYKLSRPSKRVTEQVARHFLQAREKKRTSENNFWALFLQVRDTK